MKLTTVKEIYTDRETFLDQEVTVGGWVRSVRGSKAFGFIVLHDGSCFDTLQVVYNDTFKTKDKYLPGSVPCPFSLRLCDPQVFPGERLCICPYTSDHRKRL